MSPDQMGIELQHSFAANLSHLSIGDISATIEKNLLGLLRTKQAVSDKVLPKLDGWTGLSSGRALPLTASAP